MVILMNVVASMSFAISAQTNNAVIIKIFTLESSK